MTRTPLPRERCLRRIDELDADADHAQVYGITSRHEFPGDVSQALFVARFLTYAVADLGTVGPYGTMTRCPHA